MTIYRNDHDAIVVYIYIFHGRSVFTVFIPRLHTLSISKSILLPFL